MKHRSSCGAASAARFFDALESFGLVVFLVGLPLSEAAKSAGLFLAFVGFAGSLTLGGPRGNLRRPPGVALLAFVAVGAASLAVAAPGFRSPKGLFSLAATAIPYLIVADACRRPSRRVLLCGAILVGASAASFAGFAAFTPSPIERLGLPSIENAIPAAEYLGASLSMSIAILVAEWRATIVGPLTGLGLLSTAVALVMTESRGPMIGAVLGAVTAVGMSFRRKRYALLLGVLLGVTAVLFARFHPEARAVKGQLWQTRTAATRVFAWRHAADLIAERPLLGHGPGTFARHGIVYVDEFGAELQQNAHNVCVQAAVETGLLGCGALLAFLVLGIRGAFRAVRRSTWPLERAIAVGSLAGVLAILASGAFSVSTDAEPGMLLFALMGLAVPGEERRDADR